jgi:hypothetical protein
MTIYLFQDQKYHENGDRRFITSNDFARADVVRICESMDWELMNPYADKPIGYGWSYLGQIDGYVAWEPGSDLTEDLLSIFDWDKFTVPIWPQHVASAHAYATNQSPGGSHLYTPQPGPFRHLGKVLARRLRTAKWYNEEDSFVLSLVDNDEFWNWVERTPDDVALFENQPKSSGEPAVSLLARP